MTADAPNDLVAGRYRLVRRLGTGGTDSVWEARDEPLSRPVALKMVTPQGGPTESHGVVVVRALQQGRLAAGLDHPNAVTSGQVTRERTTFGLADDGGVLTISSSTVTSRS